MALLSISQALQDALQAGFSAAQAPIIVAIAIAESGLNTRVVNPRDPAGGSFGVLQINGIHTDISRQDMFDPQKSFDYAYQLSQHGTNFNPWSTYSQGAYRQYLGATSAAIGGVTVSTPTPTPDVPWWQQIIANMLHYVPIAGPLLDHAGGVGAIAAVPGDVAGGIGAGIGDVAGGIGAGIGNVTSGVLSFVTTGAERIGFFALALVIIIIGIAFLVYTPATEALSKAAPAALAAL